MSDDINSENMKSENERILFPQEPIPEEHFHVISPARMVMKRFFRSKLSIVGLTMIIFVFIFSFIGPLIVDITWGYEQNQVFQF